MAIIARASRERLKVGLIRWLPKGTYGRLVGTLGGQYVPRALRTQLYTRMARAYGIELDEVERPLEDYCSINAFFTRRLRADARRIDPDPDVAVSPVDGAVVEAGLVTGGRMIQAKGIDYTLRSLLIDQDVTQIFSGGAYVTLYLSPRDYHRIHAPQDGVVLGYRHIPGAFFPVNPPSVRHVSGLFARNERLVTYLDTSLGRMAVVKVAATGVGDISVSYDLSARTRMSRQTRRVDYPTPLPIRKGAELGTFHLGSTVILLFEHGRVELEPLAPGTRVLLGQAVARKALFTAGDAAA
jgi:phosphatidylserine decarboxylase